jgi:signal transduction histidine kinase
MANPELRPPKDILILSPGLHDEFRVDDRLYVILVKDIGANRVYMVYDITHLEQQEQELTLITILAVVLVSAALILVGFWLGGKLSEPVRDLAMQLERFRPDARGERVERRYPDEEIHIITDAINAYIKRLDGFVTREQEFINTASHELRTPVAVIAGATDVLRRIPDCPASAQRPVERIQQAANDINETINALLHLAREEPGDNMSNMQACRVEELLPKVIENHVYLLDNKEIHVTTPSIEPTVIRAPLQILKIVLSNLVRNAIEHTERGDVEINLKNNILEIKNTSPFMEPEEIAKIYRGRIHSQDSGTSGKGLGLHIIERLCSRAGWRLSLKSDKRTTTAYLDMNACVE